MDKDITEELLNDIEAGDMLSDVINETDWHSFISDEAEDVEQPPYMFKFQGVGVCPLGDIQAVKAKAKNGKTYAGSILMAAALGDNSLGWECQVEHAKVLFIDTEQAKYSTIGVQRRVHKMLGEDPKTHNDRFVTLRLRGKDPDKVFFILSAAINEYKPQLVWLDGIRDLVYDFNDVGEGSSMVRKLMTLAEENECAIVNVLHTNKGDDNMRGHLGTELANKVSDVFQITKFKEVGNVFFKMEQTEARNQDMNDFEFEINNNALPILRQLTPKEESSLKDLFRKCLYGGKSLRYGDLVDAVVDNVEKGKSPSNAKKLIKKGFDTKILEQGNMGLIRYSGDDIKPDNPFEQSDDNKAPF